MRFFLEPPAPSGKVPLPIFPRMMRSSVRLLRMPGQRPWVLQRIPSLPHLLGHMGPHGVHVACDRVNEGLRDRIDESLQGPSTDPCAE